MKKYCSGSLAWPVATFDVEEGEFLDDTQHVLLEHFADCHRSLVILVTADARTVGVAIFPYPQRREIHRYAVGTGSEATYRGHGVIAKQASVVGLEQGECLQSRLHLFK